MICPMLYAIAMAQITNTLHRRSQGVEWCRSTPPGLHKNSINFLEVDEFMGTEQLVYTLSLSSTCKRTMTKNVIGISEKERKCVGRCPPPPHSENPGYAYK